MGRCQAGFCSPRTMEILARELNIPMSEITKSGGNPKLSQERIRISCNRKRKIDYENIRYSNYWRRPAGLAAAVSARENGIQDILILERDKELGGILNQCIHNGFGLHTFKEELTGPEYAGRFIKQVMDLGIEYKLHTMVMDISSDKIVTAMNREEGLFEIQAGAVILAMGCRERSRGALNIPGIVRQAFIQQEQRSDWSIWKGICREEKL